MDKLLINNRFIEAIFFLIDKKVVKNKSEICQKFNISASKFSEILNKRMLAGTELLSSLCKFYNISSDWLLLNEGKMLKEQPELPRQNATIDTNTIDIYIDKITKQAEQIGELKNENKNLKKQVIALQTELECCKKRNTELRGAVDLHTRAAVELYEPPEVPMQLVAVPDVKYNAKNKRTTK
ncbi:MAG: hypothetical protein LBK94_00095 [Prevotellaceae bacterium]|jgi:hypothetical protein|nr:hypothetical protein [Prevotellaceae bacterium]